MNVGETRRVAVGNIRHYWQGEIFFCSFKHKPDMEFPLHPSRSSAKQIFSLPLYLSICMDYMDMKITQPTHLLPSGYVYLRTYSMDYTISCILLEFSLYLLNCCSCQCWFTTGNIGKLVIKIFAKTCMK